jgi:Ca-activated chloride channel homolog
MSGRNQLVLLALVATVLVAARAQAQGVLINVNTSEQVVLPRPPIIIWPPYPPHRPPPSRPPVEASTYKIKSLEVNAKLDRQVARVQVSQSFVNTGSRPMEVSFVFPLPYDGAVDQLTLLIDGKEFPAKLLDAKEARRMYEEIVRKNKDPALLEWMGTGLFKTSVFPVPPGAERKVTLRYSQLCRNWDGLTDFIFPLSTAKYTSHPVEEIKLNVSIETDVDLKNVYSPSHSVDLKRPDDKHAVVAYTAKDTVPTEDFRLFFDVGKGVVGTNVLSYRPKTGDDGYFLLLTSPKLEASEERSKKTVLVVLDRSGSMSGKKVEQAKGAAKFVINNLREGDLFNLIAYDSEVESWKPELQKYSDETRKAAIGFIEGLYAGGSTNIDGALTKALGQLQDSSRPNFVIFLTDGLPTVGETKEAKIVANAREKNKVHARIFDFGVGYDVNSRLLDKLARENFGLSEYVRPNEDIERAVAALYNRIGAPIMSDVKLSVDLEGASTEDGNAVNRMYPKSVVDLFAGEQLVLVGRYKKPGAAKVTITGKVGDKEQKFNFPVKFVEKSDDESQAFVEKLWAVRRIGEILDEIDLKGKNDELTKELVSLSLQHGIMTPYTSFMADENAKRGDLALGTRYAGERLRELERLEGESGVEQRLYKQQYQSTNQPAAASPGRTAISGGAGGGQGGFGDRFADSARGRGGQVSGNAFGMVPGAKDEADKIVQNVRQLGSKTFYRRADRWIDGAVPEKQEKPATKLARFSSEYFGLIDKFGRDVAKYLAQDEPVTFELGGQVYEVE